MNYALISNGVVVNIIQLHPTNEDVFKNAVRIGAVPVDIGDEYVDGVFYKNGVEKKIMGADGAEVN